MFVLHLQNMNVKVSCNTRAMNMCFFVVFGNGLVKSHKMC